MRAAAPLATTTPTSSAFAHGRPSMMHAAHVPNGSTRTNGPCRCTSVAVHVRCKDGKSGGRPDGQRAARVLGQPANAIIQKQLLVGNYTIVADITTTLAIRAHRDKIANMFRA